MKKSSMSWSVKQVSKMIEKGTINFDYPIQRTGNQWDLLQKSLLIHSLAEDFPVPSLYTITEEKEIEGKKKNIYYILDGKQRLTNIKNFLQNDYILHEDTPDAEIDGEKYKLASKSYDDLDEEVRDKIDSFMIQIYKLEETTDEQIEELFFRLNNGTPLSKQQKAKAKMGMDWAIKIKDLTNHELMRDKASFTELQKRKADDETVILQTMMLLDEEYDLKSISSNDVFKYAQTLRDNKEKFEIIDQVKKAMDYLNTAFEEKESVLLKKIHFPMTLLTALKAIELEIHPMKFSDWKDEFKRAIKGKSELKTKYRNYSGAGSVKKEKVYGRVEEMQKHMETYFNEVDNSDRFQVTETD